MKAFDLDKFENDYPKFFAKKTRFDIDKFKENDYSKLRSKNSDNKMNKCRLVIWN